MSFLEDIKSFSLGELKSVNTIITTSDGRKFTETRTINGDMTVIEHDETGLGFCPDLQKDWTVGVVVPHVIVASQDVAYDQSSLAQHGVTHILNVAVGLPNAFPADYQYLNIGMYDDESEDIMNYYPECEGFIDSSLNVGGTVLIHCRAGRSRSVSIALAYMMHKKRIPVSQALQDIRKTRQCADPNPGFLRQLKNLEELLNIS